MTPTTTENLRVAIIGCGSIATRHAQGYQSVPGMDIVAGAEPNQETAQSFQERFHIPRMYSDPTEMLQQEKPDIVSVCTWYLLHMAHVVAAVEHGVKVILCEKPMALNLAEANRMVDICAAHGTKLAIGHQRRFYPAWTRARQLIGEGAIGQPVLVTGHVADGLLNTCSHVIDGIRYALGSAIPVGRKSPQPGEPAAGRAVWVMGAVERKTDRWERNVPIEDCCLGLVQFNEGVQALLQIDLTARNEPDCFTIQGTEGMLMVEPDQLRQISLIHVDKISISVPWDPEIAIAARAVGLEGAFNIAYAAQARSLKAWAQETSGNYPYRSPGSEALQTHEIMMALYQSARDHELVRLPLQVQQNPLNLMLEEGKLPVLYPGRYDIRGPESQTWPHREAYYRLRAAGLSHPEIMARILGVESMPQDSASVS
ncbi:MAG: Gfo/Idh/MocA family oxidoreductase [Chloroflexi bacterium]|nr:Gfo/Idh/MocA family oxidoreductase [Chloroflexota bacterium]